MDQQAPGHPALTWVNTILGNINIQVDRCTALQYRLDIGCQQAERPRNARHAASYPTRQRIVCDALNDTVVSLVAPARVSDPLTEVLRSGARRLIEAAVTAEFEEYLSGFVQEKLPDGRQRVVRNGHLGKGNATGNDARESRVLRDLDPTR